MHNMPTPDEQIEWISEPTSEVSPEKTEGKAASPLQKIRGNPVLLGGLVVLIILAAIGGLLYWNDLQSKVYVENSQIAAPVISINPTNPGIITDMYVSVGDQVRKDQILAKVEIRFSSQRPAA